MLCLVWFVIVDDSFSNSVTLLQGSFLTQDLVESMAHQMAFLHLPPSGGCCIPSPADVTILTWIRSAKWLWAVVSGRYMSIGASLDSSICLMVFEISYEVTQEREVRGVESVWNQFGVSSSQCVVRVESV